MSVRVYEYLDNLFFLIALMDFIGIRVDINQTNLKKINALFRPPFTCDSENGF